MSSAIALQNESAPVRPPLYVAYWGEGAFAKTESQVIGPEFVSEDNGYSQEEISRIHRLTTGQVWISPDYGTNHTITRFC